MNKIGQKIFVFVNKRNVIDLARTPAIIEDGVLYGHK